MGSTARRAAASLLALTLLAGCGGSGSGGDKTATPASKASAENPVKLSFWAWTPNIKKVVALWNAEHPEIQVRVSTPAQGDALVTKLMAANKAGNPPDLAQAEFQALPTLLMADAVADISEQADAIKGEFSDETWQLVTFGDAVYAVPQDIAPMMLLYRKDLYQRFGLKVPATWDEFAAQAKALRAKEPDRYLTTFSANDAGWFAGLSQQAGAQWWSVDGEDWTVGITDDDTKRVADYWQDLVSDEAILDQPMYTPQWNKQLNDGTLLAWPTAVWGPAVLEGIAPATKGKWAMAPLPQWDASRAGHGLLGRLLDRRHEEVQAPGRGGRVRHLAQHRPQGGRGPDRDLQRLSRLDRRPVRAGARRAARLPARREGVLHARGGHLQGGARVHLGAQRQRDLPGLQGRVRQGGPQQGALHGRRWRRCSRARWRT